MLIDAEKFSKELLAEFLELHPSLKSSDSVLVNFVKVAAEVAALAVEKYDREKAD